MKATVPARTLYTIGHSNRTSAQFLDLLKAHGLQHAVDVRTIPRSRHNPQFEQEALRDALRGAAISYEHLEGLGGLRPPRRDSVNLGWRTASFRGFADYMGSLGFAGALRRLTKVAARKRTAVMCAEAVPWRCHRSLIADALLSQGWQVLHIRSARTAVPHTPTPFLRVRDGTLAYPGDIGQGAAGSAARRPTRKVADTTRGDPSRPPKTGRASRGGTR